MAKDMNVNINLGGADALTPRLKLALESIQSLSGKAQQATRRLKDISITQNQIKGFADLKAKTGEVKEALEAARKKASELGRIAAIEEFSEKTDKAAIAARKAVNDLQEQYKNLTEKTNRARNSLRDKGIETTKVATKTRELRQEAEKLLKITERQKAVDEAMVRADRLRSRAGSLAMGGAATLGAGVGLLGGVGSTVKAYAEAENASTALRTAMMDASGKVSADFAKIDALASRLGNKLPGTTADFQDMMTMLIRQGMPAQTILQGTGEAAAYLGVQLKMAPAQAAEFAAKMQDALRAPSEDMMGVMDVIQRTFYAGVDPTNMLQGFSKVSAGMDILRVKGVAGAKVLAPLLAMADQSGMSGEAAGNAVRKVLQLSMDTKKTGAYGLNFTNGKGEHAGLNQMFAQLAKLRTMTTEKRLAAIKDIFGNDAETIQVLTLMIEKGQAGYADMAAKLQGQADLQTRVNESLGTLSAVWEAADGTWTNLKAAFGATLAPELKAITTWLGDMTAKLQAWTAEHPKATRLLAMLAAVFGVLLTVGGGFAIMIAGLMLPMAALSVVAAGLGIGLLPLVLIIGAIALAIGGVVAAFVYWDEIVATFLQWWEELKGELSRAGDLFKAVGSAIVDGLIYTIKSGGSPFVAAIRWLAEKGITAAKEALGIASPSRVFAQIGTFTAAGLAAGIATGTPNVVSTAATMANQVSAAGAPSFGASGGGAGSGGGMSIGNVTIVIEGGAGDPAAIARAVEDRLRALNARNRSEAQARFYQD